MRSWRKMHELAPVAVLTSPAGLPILDFGQNMVGWMQFTLEAPAGTTITLRHGERLDDTGDLYTANLRSAQQRVDYICRGGGVERWARDDKSWSKSVHAIDAAAR